MLIGWEMDGRVILDQREPTVAINFPRTKINIIGFRIPVISVEDAKSDFQEAWEKSNGVD
jgi:hypothetical protein